MNATEMSSLDMQTSALLRITSAIETAATLDELLMLSLGETARLMNVPRTGIMLMQDDDMHVRLVSTYPPRVTMPPPVSLATTPRLQAMFADRRPAQIENVPVEMEQGGSNGRVFQDELSAVVLEENIYSLLMVPLVTQDRVIGTLLLGTMDQPHSFSESEVALARILTVPLAAAISAFHTTEAARRRSAEIAALNDIANAITSSLDTKEVYHLVVSKLNEYFRVDAGSLLLRDDETGDLHFVMTLEGGEEKLAGVRVPCGHGVVGHVAEMQSYEIVHDPENDPRFYAKISEDTGYVPHSILCVPMLIKGRTVGVIELLNKQEGSFTDDEAKRLTRMASTIAVAIENARLFQQVATGRERLEAILNSTNDGIVMADMRGFVVTANPRAANLFQISERRLIGRKTQDLLGMLHQRAKVATAPPWLNDSDDEDEEEKRLSDVIEFELSSGPRHRYIRHFALPVHDADQVEIGQLLLFQDVSKERELAQLREDFMGMLVHDLRAPLTSIMNGITMVQRGLGGPVSEQQHDLLDISYKSSQTVLEMVNTLLDISKMEQGRMPLNYEPISPYALIDEPMDRLRPTADDNQVTLCPQLPVGLPLVEADREKLVRVLQNLLDNAIKHSPRDAQVTLGVAHVQIDGTGVRQYTHTESVALPVSLPALPENDWMVFWVSDQGQGIAPENFERIFQKFVQIEDGRKAQGTGLGLPFCKLTIESHGGQIWLESTRGQGSTFAFVLPLSHIHEDLYA
jgi:PAS domain S-box-containing protein